MRSVPQILDQLSKMFAERNAIYGDTYKNFGKIMKVLYPHGFHAETEKDWNRLAIIVQIITKQMRYANNPQQGHSDSIQDTVVYAAMLTELDEDTNSNQLPLPMQYCEHVYQGGECIECGLKYRGQGPPPHLHHLWDTASLQEYSRCKACKITYKEWLEATR